MMADKIIRYNMLSALIRLIDSENLSTFDTKISWF